MKVLISGCEGFVGSHFKSYYDSQPDTTVYHFDKQIGAQTFFNAKNDFEVDLLIHCAAVVGGRANIDGNPLAIAENLAIDSDMFRWALRTRPKQIVYFSSSAAYPVRLQDVWFNSFNDRIEGRQLIEDAIDPTDKILIGTPDNTYGWAKLTGEYLASKAIAEGLDVRVFRPFSGYGPGQSLDYPFPSFIERAKRGDNPFQIWGSGNQVRDWIHIDDIIGGVISTLDLPNPGPLNLGTGKATSFHELAEEVTRQAGYVPEFEFLTDKPAGVEYRVADVTKLSQFYTPQVSLEEGIARALTTTGD